MTRYPVTKWRRMRDRGLSFRAIAQADGTVDEKTVRRLLADGDPGPKRSGPRKRAKPSVAQVVKLWLALDSVRAVERELGVSETLVRARLAEAGLVEHPDKRPRKSTR